MCNTSTFAIMTCVNTSYIYITYQFMHIWSCGCSKWCCTFYIAIVHGHSIQCVFLLTEFKAPACVPSWNNILHGDKAQPSRPAETRKTVRQNHNTTGQLSFLRCIYYVLLNNNSQHLSHSNTSCRCVLRSVWMMSNGFINISVNVIIYGFFSLLTQRTNRKTQSAPSLTVDQVLDFTKVKFWFLSEKILNQSERKVIL